MKNNFLSASVRMAFLAFAAGLCGLTPYSSATAEAADHCLPGTILHIAMGQSEGSPDGGGPPCRDVPGHDDRQQAGVPSELSRAAVARKVELKKSLAQSMRNDAYALQQQHRYQEAVALYRESLVYWPDAGLESYVRTIEARAGQAAQGRSYVATGYGSPGRAGSLRATFRNRSSGDVTVRPGTDPANPGVLVHANDIITLTVPLLQGQVPFFVLRDGKLIASGTWHEDPRVAGSVPCLLFDDTLPERLVIMTGVRREGP